VTDEQLAELERLLVAATPGLWFHLKEWTGAAVFTPGREGERPIRVADCDVDTRVDRDTTAVANAALIASALRMLPTLIAHCSRRRTPPMADTPHERALEAAILVANPEYGRFQPGVRESTLATYRAVIDTYLAEMQASGWKLMPREPNARMFDAGIDALGGEFTCEHESMWSAMWDAASAAPDPNGETTDD
jgi:hypothetical protein